MAKPLHILHIFPSFAVGGAQMRMVALANHFGAQFAHSVVALDGDISCRDRLDPALDVTFPSIPSMAHKLPRRLLVIAATLRAIRPDLLITSNWGAIEWAIANRLAVRTRHIHTEDGFGPEERDRQIMRRVLTRRLILRSSIIIVPSRRLLDAATRIWRLSPGTVHYIPNGIDLNRFTPAPVLPARLIVGCIAGLRPEKNLGRLIRACAMAQRDHDFELVIVGDGPERSALAALATTEGTKLTLLGERSDPAACYRDFSLFALSSDTEQMPLSVMEAMASGLTVVATDVGDIKHMVSPANRDYLTARDDQSLAASLSARLAEPAALLNTGAANRRCAEQSFDFTIMAARWAQLLVAQSH